MFIIKVKEKSKLKKVGEWMGIYLNPGSAMFQKSLKSKIYVDKSGLLAILNELVDTEQRYVCVSRPRRFGKSMAANMLAAYYGSSEDTSALFATVYKGNIIKNLIMDCQSYTKYRPNETTGGIFVSWRRKEELPTGA